MKAKSLIITIALLGLISVLGGCSRWGGVDNPTGPSTVSPKVFMDPSTVTKSLNQEFTISVYIENVTNLFYANIYVAYDPAKVSFIGSEAGDFLKQGGASVLFEESANNGLAVIGISRQGSGVGGASGTGVLCKITFKAIDKGATSLVFKAENLGFRDAYDKDVEVSVGNGTTVNIN